MAGLCKAMIIGNLGRDPEMRYTPSGRAVTTFSVAVNRSFSTTEGERREETEWFRVTTWGKLAETCNQYLTKGRRVYVEGRLQLKSWEGQDGVKRSGMEITASDLVMLERPRTAATEENLPEEMEDPDDLPF